jgi:hypothetical protein
VLVRLEGELQAIRRRLQELCDAFEEKEQECDGLKAENSQIKVKIDR